VRCTLLPEKGLAPDQKRTSSPAVTKLSAGGQHTTGTLKISISKIRILDNEIFHVMKYRLSGGTPGRKRCESYPTLAVSYSGSNA
jgi:hypothetical protein